MFRWNRNLVKLFLFSIATFNITNIWGQRLVEIWQVQGLELTSPMEGVEVLLEANIVTAVVNDGFYIQTPTTRSDFDLGTSDGIKVTTVSFPEVRVKDIVSVIGVVSEADGLTQIAGDEVRYTVIGRVVSDLFPTRFSTIFPSRSNVRFPDLETVEGMLVVFDAVVCSPSNFEDVVAVTTRETRSFREPGIRYPGIEGLPIWDGNPEVFWFDPDALEEQNNRFINAGMLVSSTAILTYKDGRYTALPITYDIEEREEFQAVRDKQNGEWTIGSLNLQQLQRGDNGFNTKLDKLSRYIVTSMKAPDILAVQEVGDATGLNELATNISELFPEVQYAPYFEKGNDGIHVSYLVRNTIENVELKQFNTDSQLSLGGNLHDRPPLLLNALLDGNPIQILNLHVRSLNDIENSDRSFFVRTKRFEQSTDIAEIVQSIANQDLVVLGDFNAFEFSDGYVDVTNQITGQNSLGAEFAPLSIVSSPLVNHTALLPQEERYSFVFDGNAELIDHFVSNNLPNFTVNEVQFARGNADSALRFDSNTNSPYRCSDHDGLVAFIKPNQVISSQKNSRGVSSLRLVSPNPSLENQSIQIADDFPWKGEVYLYNALGQLILQKKKDNSDTSLRLEWPGNISEGTYWLQIITSEHLSTFPIVLKK